MAIKKVVRTLKENKSRKKDALARGAQKASDAGKGNSKRITGYYVEKSGTGKNPISGQDRPNVVKPREARPFARAEKKEAKKAVRLAAYKTVASKNLDKKTLATAKRDDKKGVTPTKGGKWAGSSSNVDAAKERNYDRRARASAARENATSRAKDAGMSDRKINRISTKATKAAVKRSR